MNLDDHGELPLKAYRIVKVPSRIGCDRTPGMRSANGLAHICLLPVIILGLLFGNPLLAQSAADTPDRPALDRYLFHDGYYAGSLRSQVPLPIYDPDPAHLWNRLFASFYIRPLRPDHASPTGPPQLQVDEKVPDELSPSLRERWHESYNTDVHCRVEGGDVLEPPLFAHPESLTVDRYYQPSLAALEEFVQQDGERLLPSLQKRAMLQRDLWQVFDVVEMLRGWHPTPSLRTPSDRRMPPALVQKRQQRLSELIGRAMRAVALSDEEIARLPDNYGLAAGSGRFTQVIHGERLNKDLPKSLLDGAEDWVEIVNGLDGVLAHARNAGFAGRAWFRLFYRFPPSAGGRQALERFLARGVTRDANGLLLGPDVPPGTQVALVRMMLLINRAGEIRATPIVEELQIRSLLFVDAAAHLDTDSGRGQDFREYELRRASWFIRPDAGGLEPVPIGELRYFFGIHPFASFAFGGFLSDPERPHGALLPLRESCTACHQRFDSPIATTRGSVQQYPAGFPFGKASILSMQQGQVRPVAAGESRRLAENVIAWKKAQPAFENLRQLMIRR